jgi:asparagine synthase (glutamine-hydrolysing)
MCGIFGVVNRNKHSDYKKYEKNVKHRGPDTTQSLSHHNIYFCFHRLRINDLSDLGNQPFEDDNYIWMCNGEIYNYKTLIDEYDLVCNGNSDCEVIGKLIHKVGIDKLYDLLDGVFAICIYEKKTNKLHLMRDPIGVRPLYYCKYEDRFMFASEGKALQSSKYIKQLEPSTIMTYDCNNHTHVIKQKTVFDYKITDNLTLDSVIPIVNHLLVNSIQKRLLSDRPIGCLLSGGLDSSIVASVLSKLLKEKGKMLKTFSVGFEDSEDLKYARKVATYLGTDHYELILNYKDVIKRIPEVITAIESYDVTTIRASVGMYLLAEYIATYHFEKVIFSGEGSDEIFGGYLYFHKSPSFKQFEDESKRLVQNLYYYDVLRADRCTSSFGLELRVPFLDKTFVKFVTSISGYLRKLTTLEKYILRRAFKDDYLPVEIIKRQKEGFSDGVGGMKKPFYRHIQEFIADGGEYDNLDELEQEYYKNEYHKSYEYEPIKEYWMPKWIKTNNPSGRILMNS